MTSSEQRQFPRVSSSATVECTKLTYPLPETSGQAGLSRNIGVDGICVTSSTAYIAGDILSLRMHLPGWQRFRRNVASIVDDTSAVAPLTAVVEVVWCKPTRGTSGYEIGVRFRDVYEDDRKALMKYIENLKEGAGTL